MAPAALFPCPGTRIVSLASVSCQAFYAAVQQAGGEDGASVVSETPSMSSFGGSLASSAAAGGAWAVGGSFPETVLEDAPYAPSYASQPLYGQTQPAGATQAQRSYGKPAYAVPVGHYEPSLAGSASGSYAPSYAAPSYAPSYAPSEVRPHAAPPPSRA